jgi:hypothetical protein
VAWLDENDLNLVFSMKESLLPRKFQMVSALGGWEDDQPCRYTGWPVTSGHPILRKKAVPCPRNPSLIRRPTEHG